MHESPLEGPRSSEEQDFDQETPSMETNEEWVDLASALDSVSTPFEEEGSDRVSILTDVREALKQQILEHLYAQVVDELGSPEDMVRHVLKEYAEDVDESLQGARQTLVTLLRRKISKQATEELDDVDALARRVVSDIDPEALAHVRKRVNAILGKQLLDQAIRELQQQIMGGDADLLGKWLGDTGRDSLRSSVTHQDPAPASTESDPGGTAATRDENAPDKASTEDEPEILDADSWSETLQEEMARVIEGGDTGPQTHPTRDLRVQARCDAEVLIKKQQSTDKQLSETLTGIPDMILTGTEDDTSGVSEEEIKVLARHVGERCHRALAKIAEDFLANMVDVDEQTESPLLVLDTLYHVPSDNFEAFQKEVDRLGEQYQNLGFRLKVSEREGVSL